VAPTIKENWGSFKSLEIFLRRGERKEKEKRKSARRKRKGKRRSVCFWSSVIELCPSSCKGRERWRRGEGKKKKSNNRRGNADGDVWMLAHSSYLKRRRGTREEKKKGKKKKKSSYGRKRGKDRALVDISRFPPFRTGQERWGERKRKMIMGRRKGKMLRGAGGRMVLPLRHSRGGEEEPREKEKMAYRFLASSFCLDNEREKKGSGREEKGAAHALHARYIFSSRPRRR